MNNLVQKAAVLIAAAAVAACVAQREEREPADATEPSIREEHESYATDSRAVAAPAAPIESRRTAAAIKADVANAAAPQLEFCCPPLHPPAVDTERYGRLDDHPVRLAAEQPVSTFSIDVDTGAYANVRRFLHAGRLPPQDAVRVEELVNYFDYRYPAPTSRDRPFNVFTELAPAPWNPQALLLKIGLKGFEIAAAERPPANLVFLIDVSGSMQSPDKLPLLKNALRLLTQQLTARDRVSMVVYAGRSGVVLEPTAGDRKHVILAALDQLEAGGSTNGAEGLERAYQLAQLHYTKEGVNRIVLATDGDFNVGVVSFEALIDKVERERRSGVALSALGFGTGNYNDHLLERLADAGDGAYAYVDSLAEARKVLVSELSSTLYTIAADVKIQVEFNPAEVLEYRLIGYENRMLAREDFNNDQIDAGEIDAGHRVTALYEITPSGARGRIDPLRYGAPAAVGRPNGELAHIRLRYRRPGASASELLELPVLRRSILAAEATSPDFRLAASVAAFGQLLRGGKYLGDFGFEQIERLASDGLSQDAQGYRREFVSLVQLAQTLQPPQPAQLGRTAP